jgi:hypothetical protein
MSSVLRSISNGAEAKTKFVSCRSVSYYNGELNHNVLVPFLASNGVLDVSVIPGFNPSDGGYYDRFRGTNWRKVKPMGGVEPIKELGANFVTWFTNAMQNWVDDNEGDSVSITNVKLYQPGIMTKVAQVNGGGESIDVGTNSDVWLNTNYGAQVWSASPPPGDEFVTGDDTNNFNTSWVFKSPVVISFVYSGATYYTTFSSEFTQSS